MAALSPVDRVRAGVRGACRAGPSLVFSRYILLAVSGMAFSRLGEAGFRTDRDRQSLLVRFHPAARIVGLGTGRNAGAVVVCVATQTLSLGKPVAFPFDRPAPLSQPAGAGQATSRIALGMRPGRRHIDEPVQWWVDSTASHLSPAHTPRDLFLANCRPFPFDATILA